MYFLFEIYFAEGVLVCPKNVRTDCDFKISEDAEGNVVSVRNLHVMKMMQSLKSRGFLKESFTWQYHYYFLTDEGIDYLRKFLHLPAEIVPLTLKKTAIAKNPRPSNNEGEGEGRRGGFRGGKGKDMGPGDNFRPGFRREGGGFGRGGAPRE